MSYQRCDSYRPRNQPKRDRDERTYSPPSSEYSHRKKSPSPFTEYNRSSPTSRRYRSDKLSPSSRKYRTNKSRSPPTIPQTSPIKHSNIFKGLTFYIDRSNYDSKTLLHLRDLIRFNGGSLYARPYESYVTHIITFIPSSKMKNQIWYIENRNNLNSEKPGMWDWTQMDLIRHFSKLVGPGSNDYWSKYNRKHVIREEWLNQCIKYNKLFDISGDYDGWEIKAMVNQPEVVPQDSLNKSKITQTDNTAIEENHDDPAKVSGNETNDALDKLATLSPQTSELLIEDHHAETSYVDLEIEVEVKREKEDEDSSIVNRLTYNTGFSRSKSQDEIPKTPVTHLFQSDLAEAKAPQRSSNKNNLQADDLSIIQVLNQNPSQYRLDKDGTTSTTSPIHTRSFNTSSVSNPTRSKVFERGIIPLTFFVHGSGSNKVFTEIAISDRGGFIVSPSYASIFTFPSSGYSIQDDPKGLEILKHLSNQPGRIAISVDWVQHCIEQDDLLPLDEYIISYKENSLMTPPASCQA
ncbi:uncharacterized protein I206_106254 [Kwoniella pini CBS 10737]|uniref:BRCT domain-containing protein n=1 Tax=Kwoniella pini CBS 10737 TaxID=1296096 RepID=A0A1B9I1H9_9TREE|nr:uncharacterized protein I206_05080 [Kwoniella pini CBS 10737]OCF49387.1 hypothetical protein I206_05080 [Kwoniella pini CBS 10737]